MAIDLVTPPTEITAQIDEFNRRNEAAVLETLKYIGEQCENEAKTNANYKDQTGNLRASSGYAIYNNGNIVFSSSSLVGEAERVAYYVSLLYPEGAALILVSGMSYSAAVEAKNYNVLTSAELLAEQLMPQLMANLTKQ